MKKAKNENRYIEFLQTFTAAILGLFKSCDMTGREQ